MHTKTKLIADIRLYENQGRTSSGNVEHGRFGVFYSIPHKHFGDVATRFACKLREFGFKLPGFDHLNVILTPSLSAGQVEMSDVVLEQWARYIDAGIPNANWNALGEFEKHDLLVDLIESALLLGSKGEQAEDVARVSHALKTARSELEINLKERETQRYVTKVSFQITPLYGQSKAYLSYLDKRSNAFGRKMLCKLQLASDIYALFGSITVKDGAIVVSPRKSFRAKVLTERYSTPFTVRIEELIGDVSP